MWDQIRLGCHSDSRSAPSWKPEQWHVSVSIGWHRWCWNISWQRAQVSLCLTLRTRMWRSAVSLPAATPSSHCWSSPKVLRFSSSSFNVVVQISLFMPPKFKYLQKAKTAMNNTNNQLALMSDYHTILMLYTMLQKWKPSKCFTCSLFILP